MTKPTNQKTQQESWRKKIALHFYNANYPEAYTKDEIDGYKKEVDYFMSIISTERQRVIEEVREVIEGFKNGQNVIINAVNRSKKSELAEPLLAQNQILCDLLQELNELEKTND